MIDKLYLSSNLMRKLKYLRRMTNILKKNFAFAALILLKISFKTAFDVVLKKKYLNIF